MREWLLLVGRIATLYLGVGFTAYAFAHEGHQWLAVFLGVFLLVVFLAINDMLTGEK